MQARATPRMYFCVEVQLDSCQKTPYRQTVKTLSGENIEKKKRKKREKAMSETSRG